MPAADIDLTIEQGATWSLPLTYQTTNGTAINLTGSLVRMQARQSYAANITIISLSTATGGITFTSAANGTFAALISANDTANLPPGIYPYDLELVLPDGTVARLLSGSISVSAEVTRA